MWCRAASCEGDAHRYARPGAPPLDGLAGNARYALVVGVVVQDDELGHLGAPGDQPVRQGHGAVLI